MKKTTITGMIVSIILYIFAVGQVYAVPASEAGFINLDANDFYFHRGSYFNRIALRSSPARIWYTFQAADHDPAGKPLFVFFNGGPCSATSSALFCANTARLSVHIDQNTGDPVIVDNPASWTKYGNIMHIDSRTAGFSYSMMDNPGDTGRRIAEFEAGNYNPYTDGTDFVRVILRFLAAHPELRDNPVVIVGESYGGIRTTAMMHILLFYTQYADGQSIYQNPGLVREIQNHYDRVFPGYSGQPVPPGVITRQFGHQVFIQPAITWFYQKQIQAQLLEAPGSIVYRLAEETGIPYVRCDEQPGSDGNCDYQSVLDNVYIYLDSINRNYYHAAMPSDWMGDRRRASMAMLLNYESFCRLTGVDVAEITGLYASSRQNAYKFRLTNNRDSRNGNEGIIGLKAGNAKKNRDPLSLGLDTPQADESDLSSRFGALSPWDTYYLSFNEDANVSFSYNTPIFAGYPIDYRYTDRFGEMFLENTAVAETFITNAYWDTVVHSPAIPPALGNHTDYLSQSRYDGSGPGGEARPGQILLQYRPGAAGNTGALSKAIRFPSYLTSGHMVPLNEAWEFREDVISWLGSTGLTINAGQDSGKQ